MSKIKNFEMEMPQLGRKRTVWVYLPDNYSEGGEPLPVIYMHDGQNLFYDSLTAYGAAWHVDKVMEYIFVHSGNSAIVVGVECDSNLRLSEYSPWKASPLKRGMRRERKENRGGEGKQYGEFLTKTLKPYIDAHYNTDPSRHATAIAGSSMGGLISCYLGLNYQDVYETMGLFSTYTEFNQRAFDRFVKATPQRQEQYAFIYCGGKEWENKRDSERIENSACKLYRTLKGRAIHCEFVLNSDLPHYETSWEKYFYNFADGFLSRYHA